MLRQIRSSRPDVFCEKGVRGGSRTAETSKIERFVIIVNDFQPLTIITKRSNLDVAAVLDPSMGVTQKFCKIHKKIYQCQSLFFNKVAGLWLLLSSIVLYDCFREQISDISFKEKIRPGMHLGINQLMADKIFENKVGWFSNSCANQVIAKWGKLII